MYWPIIKTLGLSFYDWNMISPKMDWVGIENYIHLLKSPETYQSFSNTLLYIVFLLIFNFLIPYGVAFMVSNLISRLKGFYRSVIFMPSVISTVVASVIFVWVVNPIIGPIALILSEMNLDSPLWLKSSSLAILVLSVITAWKSFGYNFLVLLAGINEVPVELIEVAKLNNASNFQIFKKIILPLTSSTAVYVFVITIVFGLQYVFVPIHILTQGGPDNASTNLVYSIYQYGFRFFQTGKAAAFSILTMVIFALLMVLEFKYLEKEVYYEN